MGYVERPESHIVQHSRLALAALSVDLDGLPADRDGWTEPDIDSLVQLSLIEVHEPRDLPPPDASLDDRYGLLEPLKNLHGALPFDEVERYWLLDEMLDNVRKFDPHSEGYLDRVSSLEADCVVNGVRRTLSVRDGLSRFWSWRHEVGVYSSGEGLRQAKVSLASLVRVLTTS